MELHGQKICDYFTRTDGFGGGGGDGRRWDCIDEWGDVPFVVRAKVQGKWVLVGHCYLHGIMQGEAFDKGQCENMVLA